MYSLQFTVVVYYEQATRNHLCLLCASQTGMLLALHRHGGVRVPAHHVDRHRQKHQIRLRTRAIESIIVAFSRYISRRM